MADLGMTVQLSSAQWTFTEIHYLLGSSSSSMKNNDNNDYYLFSTLCLLDKAKNKKCAISFNSYYNLETYRLLIERRMTARAIMCLCLE